ncbi:kinase-like protein [Coniophora puteana RWD-64-598 SS2]|uniref:non-specific serine/threonine protein kinase n=1 Tax=Coniophora puteana (strain RWD-64-598) TaxID=741705 RepID=A0A5M3MWL9_CONPW|nr:kinase-like protein [Coniophora puteana RWD-64-598 SS2]EIW83144.1 kinase-like protein [Coniophora puteana RWD-64-598 SS2]
MPARPLPTPPGPPGFPPGSPYAQDFTWSTPSDLINHPSPYPYPSQLPPTQDVYEGDTAQMLPAGTLLHKGFYDLLAMIPTPSPSRLFWGQERDRTIRAPPGAEIVAGPRYEDIKPIPIVKDLHPPSSPPAVKKNRRISKDMVGRPTGFVHLVHASDADQYEALLVRWGPDGLGKLGDPRWAKPIKSKVRDMNQARAVNQVVNALKPSQTSGQDSRLPLRVVNGGSTNTSSTVTTAARENVRVSPVDGLPGGRPGNSTIRWAGGLMAHPEEDDTSSKAPEPEPVAPPRSVEPSLATLEKAVSARIFFENLYFPLLRQPPSREQRRLAMEKDMTDMCLSEEQKEMLRGRWRQNETDYLRERRRKVDVTAFIKLKTIGHGAFGVVSLVKERATGQLYAMKQLRKVDMLRKGQEGHVRAERDVLKSASLVTSPGGAEWIVKLHYSFQDRDNLYLVLEYMGGGDLLNLLIERDVFEEDFTRFYVAEMILAIESCHKHGFIHRDIKPDNFLFDPEGHIRLSDFGLATDLHWAHDTSYYEQQRRHLLHKHGIDLDDGNGIADGTKTRRMDRKDIELLMGDSSGKGGIFTWREKNRRKLAYSVCGTNSYMSPEVIRGQGYSFSCDWWSLGVIMFECLYGFPPFVSNSRHVTRQKILNWRQSLKFPSRPHVSQEGINLMKQLLCEPEDRLGSQASSSVFRPDSLAVHGRRSGFMLPGTATGCIDGAHLIKAHPWFRGIDWQSIHRYPAPYKPELITPEDTRHFDSDIPAEPLAPANGAPPDATKDPLLRDRLHGEEILNVRKALAFAGFTHKAPRVINYARADQAFADPGLPDMGDQETIRGRSRFRQSRDIGTGRAISL